MNSTSTRTARRAVTFGAGIILGLSFLTGAASAAPKSERPPSTTEDNDTTDNDPKAPVGNNVSDEGDNAHPSGKDRSVEHGGSGNQGKTQSDPDNDGHGPDRNSGGIDQPGRMGGVDKDDQDGNNGCGNDDDFEDDNEGWCGKPKATDTPTPVVNGGDFDKPTIVTPAGASTDVLASAPAAPAATVPEVAAIAAIDEVVAPAAAVEAKASPRATSVLGVSIEREAAASPETGRRTEVLGVSFERGSLARTGFGLTIILAIAGLALVAVGLTLKKLTPQAS